MRKVAYATALVALGIALIYNYCFTYNYVQVNTDKGILRGFKMSTQKGTSFFSFKGIPYAKPPIGELRFKGPQENTAWTGVWDALIHGNVCPQTNFLSGIFEGQEDCLFLNVYTPFLGDENLPVMVWIHGGGFESGSGNDDLYGPDYLIDAGVILVTINYRLGPFGFLSTEDDGAPGNAGLKDQVAALRWVRRNIKRFGGDPENVTIFGESAGAASVHYHLLSPMSAGLFARAIGQSGSSINPWVLRDDLPALTVKLAEYLQAKDIDGDAAKALQVLNVTSLEDIYKAFQNLKITEKLKKGALFFFVPTVEKNVKSEEVFLPDRPQNILKSGNFNKVPYITGLTTHESYLLIDEAFNNMEFKRFDFGDPECYVPYEFENEPFRHEFGESIFKFYLDNKPVGSENMTNLVNLYSDVLFMAGTNRATKLQLQSSKTPIYYYIFSYAGTRNLYKILLNLNNLPGASHADELGYLFYSKMLDFTKPKATSEDEYVVQTMVRLWTNFAKYGDPTPLGDPPSWKPVTLDEFNYLNISGRDTRSAINPEAERTNFWEKAYEKYENFTRINTRH